MDQAHKAYYTLQAAVSKVRQRSASSQTERRGLWIAQVQQPVRISSTERRVSYRSIVQLTPGIGQNLDEKLEARMESRTWL